MLKRFNTIQGNGLRLHRHLSKIWVKTPSFDTLKKWRGEESPSVLRRRGCQWWCCPTMHGTQISLCNSLYNRARLHSHFGGYALQPRTWILEKS
jgi:hypothetical protein